MTRRIFLASVPLAARRWDREEWNAEFASKLLTDSPWAKPVASKFRFRFPIPGVSRFAQIGEPGSLGLPKWGGRPAPQSRPAAEDIPAETEANLTVRWASALPLRRARAVLENSKLLESPEEFVIEIAGYPTTFVTQGVRRMEAELLESAEILVKGKRPLRASSASVPEHGTHLMATLRFPRAAGVTASDGTVTVSAKAGAIAVAERFPLREMIYSGNLEL